MVNFTIFNVYNQVKKPLLIQQVYIVILALKIVIFIEQAVIITIGKENTQ